MNNLKNYVYFYTPKAPFLLAFMLQRTDYNPNWLISWLLSNKKFQRLMVRNKFHKTLNSVAFLIACYIFYIALISLIIFFAFNQYYLLSILILVFMPIILIIGVSIVAIVLKILLINNLNNIRLRKAQKFYSEHSGIRIAVLGSYGKTSTKEILNNILQSDDQKVSRSPLNKNTALSHAIWAEQLHNDEDVLIIEYGEEKPGDIKKLADITKPTHAIITGIAPNHLEHFKNIGSLRKELNSIYDFVKPENTFVSKQYYEYRNDQPSGVITYGIGDVDGWTASEIKLFADHTEFKAKNKSSFIDINTKLLGEHNVPTIILSIAVAKRIGVSDKRLEHNTNELQPFEHRMQHYILAGADIIDDTYNGNLEGFRAGLKLLSDLNAKRKIYVTPGLVDQGSANTEVHKEIGKLIYETKPDLLVLMQNSNTNIILNYLEKHDFSGRIFIEDNPLTYYQNLEHFVVPGDLVLMQNDLPDEYY